MRVSSLFGSRDGHGSDPVFLILFFYVLQLHILIGEIVGEKSSSFGGSKLDYLNLWCELTLGRKRLCTSRVGAKFW